MRDNIKQHYPAAFIELFGNRISIEKINEAIANITLLTEEEFEIERKKHNLDENVSGFHIVDQPGGYINIDGSERAPTIIHELTHNFGRISESTAMDEIITEYITSEIYGELRGSVVYTPCVRKFKQIISAINSTNSDINLNMSTILDAFTTNNLSLISRPIDILMGEGYFKTKLLPELEKSYNGEMSSELIEFVIDIASKSKEYEKKYITNMNIIHECPYCGNKGKGLRCIICGGEFEI